MSQRNRHLLRQSAFQELRGCHRNGRPGATHLCQCEGRVLLDRHLYPHLGEVQAVGFYEAYHEGEEAQCLVQNNMEVNDVVCALVIEGNLRNG
jgi:hypothetical protein